MTARYFYCERKGDKLLMWDEKRLWRLSQDLPVKAVPVESISTFDDNCWFPPDAGAKPSCKAVAEHAKRIYEADLAHPVILSAGGKLMDGMHRVAKAWILGMKEVRAVQFSADPQPDRILPLRKKATSQDVPRKEVLGKSAPTG